jgi:hypothetical protein
MVGFYLTNPVFASTIGKKTYFYKHGLHKNSNFNPVYSLTIQGTL